MNDAADNCFRFDAFVLDPADRQLRSGDGAIELNARYFDALTLLVRERGRLVSKDRFHEEVWRGIPVTDEALTQCIRTLRRQLGDDAANPRLIETVPKHGYRFVAEVEGASGRALPGAAVAAVWPGALRVAAAGTLGGGAAGLVGGLFYGFVAASRPPGEGAISVLLVLLCVTAVVALIGAAGVALGIAVARAYSRRGSGWDVLGGAAGGLVVGAVVKLVGLDTFALLFGRAPQGMTGAPEGLLLGGAVGLGAWALGRWPSRWGVVLAGLAGASSGLVAVIMGGHLFGGSLALLAAEFPGSRLSLAGIGALFGEAGFGPRSALVTAGLEGLLFSACIATAMLIAERKR